MYMDDDMQTPRDRISDELLQRMLNGSDGRRTESPAPRQAPHRETEDGACVPDRTWGLRSYPLASVYAPLQEFRELYDRPTALKHGTLFAELNLPFLGKTVNKGGCNHV